MPLFFCARRNLLMTDETQTIESPAIIPPEEKVVVSRDFTPAEIAQVDAGFWAYRNQVKLQNGLFSFKNHEYQVELMGSMSRRLVCMKGAQGGFTEAIVLLCLHGMIIGRFPLGCLFLFPSGDDVSEFSKARFGPLIAANYKSIGKYVKSTDSTTLKRIGKAFLYLRGARLSQTIDGDDKESSKLRSISVDLAAFDEADLMPTEAIEKVRNRMGHSTQKREIFLSNPTLPDYGIDQIFKQSDQRYWWRKCEACGTWTCAELSFPECVKFYPKGQEVNGFRGYIGCDKCGKPVLVSAGDWRPSRTENSDYMHGYRWSQLTSIYVDPAEILEAYNDPPEGNLADVYRLRLGLPYVATEDKLQESQVYNCCGDYLPPSQHSGPAAIGVDVGKLKHVVILIRTGDKQYELVRATAVSEWADIHDLAKRYGVRSGVVDIRPYEDSARAFQASEPYPIHLCEYSETQASGPQFNANTGIVKCNRTEICDQTHRLITTLGMFRIPRMCQEVQAFAKQVCATAKVLETNKKTGVAIYRYKGVGTAGDHFRHALNYAMLAASGGKIARVDHASRERPRHAINRFKVGVKV